MTAIDPRFMAFRRERATDLEQLARLSNRYRIDISKNGSFKEALRLLRSDQHLFEDERGNPDPSLWGYTITHLPIPITTIPRHTFPAVKQLTLRISIKFAAECQGWQKMQDPTRKLNLDVLLLGTDKHNSNCLTSYHLDKHIDPVEQPKKPVNSEIHPLYHVQFSSGKVRKEPEAVELDFEKAGSLFLDIPRLLHHPMDLVLGLDFLIANYFPAAWSALQRDGNYANLCRKYQNAFWKPYVHAIARHWNMHTDNEYWNAKQAIWPNLL